MKDTLKTSGDDSSDERNIKRMKSDNTEVSSCGDNVYQEEEAEEVCIVCMETNLSDKQLVKHQCHQCAENAWKICVCCNEALLSRTCPVCRSEYAPIILYSMPGVPLHELANTSLEPESKAFLLYKFGIIRHLISKSNVAVWSPSSSQLHFSLPQEFSDDTKDFGFLTVSIPMEVERVAQGKFCFSNSVWDEIESELERPDALQDGAGGAENLDNTGGSVNEIQSPGLAMQWILGKTRERGAIIFTAMTPAEWEFMMDPQASTDTAEAVRTIRENLVDAPMSQTSVTNGTEEK